MALDGLDDVEADVVPLTPTRATPHVELLHYRRPAGISCGPVAVKRCCAIWTAICLEVESE